MPHPNSLRLDLARFLPGIPTGMRDWIGRGAGEDVDLPMDPGGQRDPRLPPPDALDALVDYVRTRKAAEGSTLDQVQQGAGAVRRLGQPAAPQQSAPPAQSIQELQRRIDQMGIR